MKKNVLFLKLFSLALGFVLLSATADAQTRTASVDGDWNSIVTWGGQSVPTAANPVIINGGIQVNVTVNAAAASINIVGNGGDLDVSAGATLAVTNAITLENDANGSRSFSLIGAGSITCASMRIGGTATSLNNDGTTTMTSSITSLSIAGNLDLFGEDDSFDDNNAVFSIPAGSVTVGGTVRTDEENGSSVTLQLDNVAPETGTLILNGATPFQNVVGTLTFDADGTGATVRYAGGAQDIPVANYRHLTLDGTNINTDIKTLAGDITLLGSLLVGQNATLQLAGDDLNLSQNSQTATINGRLVIDGLGRLNNTGGSGTLALGGNPGQLFLTAANSTLPTFESYAFTSTSVVYYASAGAQTIATAPNILYGNLVTGDDGFGAGNGSGVKSINSSVEVINSVVIGQNTTLACQAGGANSDNITIGGTWLNNGTFVAADDQVIFDGTSTQELRGPVVTTFNNIRINKVDPEFGTRLTVNAIVTGVVTFSSGFFGSDNGSVLIMNAGSSHTGANDNSKATCAVRKIGNTAFTFPIGKNDMYSPVTITAPDNIADAFQAEYIRGNASALGPVQPGIGLTNVSFCEYWILDESNDAGTANSVNVTVTWDAQSPCSGTDYITNVSGLTLAHFNGTVWDSHGGTATGTPTAGSLTRNAVNTFSPFSFGNTISGANPLPVKFSSITAFEKQAGIQIDWTAYEEVNVNTYTIERSADGYNFTSVGSVASANSAVEKKYGFFDANPLPGVSFYRLRNLDFDGKSGLSNIVRVNLDKTVKDIRLYPNPVNSGYVSLQSADLARGIYTVAIYNAGGQRVISKQFNHNGGSINQTIQLPANTQSGLYMLQLDNDGVRVMAKSFIVQQ